MSITPARPPKAYHGYGRAYALTAFLVVVIAVLTLAPQAPGPPGPPGVDKIAHFVAFAMLVLPLGLTRTDNWVWVASAALIYGAAIELIQPQVGRGAEWGDLFADGAGVVFGLLGARIWLCYRAAKGSSG